MSTPRKTTTGWELWLTATADGRKHRRHIRGRTRADVLRASEATRTAWYSGVLPDGGEVTLGAWLEVWVRERHVAGVRPSTLSGYRTDRKHLARVRRSLDRTRWYHGCNDPTGHRAAKCPQRAGGGGAAPLNTKGSTRTLALPGPLMSLLRAHRATQARAGLAASELWDDHDWVFASVLG